MITIDKTTGDRTGGKKTLVVTALIGAVALTLGASACSKNENTEKQTTQATSAESAESAPASIAAVKAVMPHYDAVRAALVEDQGQDAVKAASELADAATRAQRSADAQAAAHLEALAKSAGAFAKLDAGDLDAMRGAFGDISQPMVALVEGLPADTAKGYHIFECGMAEGFNRWVQTDPELANPYMGTSMPACGEEVSMK